jgi:hypothetical protein
VVERLPGRFAVNGITLADMPPPSRQTPAERARTHEMYTLYKSGRTLAEVGRAYGIGGERVRQRFEKMGLPRRSSAETTRMLDARDPA